MDQDEPVAIVKKKAPSTADDGKAENKDGKKAKGKKAKGKKAKGKKAEKKSRDSRAITDPSTLKASSGAPERVKLWIAAAQKLKVGERRTYTGRNAAIKGKTVEVAGFLADGGVHISHDGKRSTATPFSLGVPNPARVSKPEKKKAPKAEKKESKKKAA